MRFTFSAVTLFVLSAIVATAQAGDPAVYTPENGVSSPTLVKRVDATYTLKAKAAGIAGWVVLVVVVRPDGTVGEVKIGESCWVTSALSERLMVIRSAVEAATSMKR
jgi:hypothetical protein